MAAKPRHGIHPQPSRKEGVKKIFCVIIHNVDILSNIIHIVYLHGLSFKVKKIYLYFVKILAFQNMLNPFFIKDIFKVLPSNAAKITFILFLF